MTPRKSLSVALIIIGLFLPFTVFVAVSEKDSAILAKINADGKLALIMLGAFVVPFVIGLLANAVMGKGVNPMATFFEGMGKDIDAEPSGINNRRASSG